MADKVECPNCRYPNDPAASACRLCGDPLVPGAAQEQAGPAPGPARPAARSDARGRGTPEAGRRAAPPPPDPGADAAVGAVPLLGSPPAAFPALVRVVEGGGDGEVTCLKAEPIRIGRGEGDLVFPEDGLLSGLHAAVRSDGQVALVRDLKSRNGTFVRRSGRIPIADGTECLLGRTLLRWIRRTAAPPPRRTLEFGDESGATGVFVTVGRPRAGRPAEEIPMPPGSTIGRAGQTLTLDDRFVSLLHARIQAEGDRCFLLDESNANGIYVRTGPEEEVTLAPGEQLQVGRQVFRFDLRQ